MSRTTPSSVKFPVIHAGGVGAIIVVTAIAYGVGIAPAQRSRDAAVAERQTLAERTQELSELEAQAREAAGRVRELKGKLAESKVRLESASQINSQVGRLTALAEAASLRIFEVTPGESRKGARYSQVPIRLTGESNYAAFTTFVESLHHEFPDVEVSSFKIAGHPDSPSAPAQFALELAWYTLADK